MGKSYNKDRPDKWRHKNEKKNKNHGFKSKNRSYSPFEDLPEYHSSFEGGGYDFSDDIPLKDSLT